jgi:uncharacterized membrane protein
MPAVEQRVRQEASMETPASIARHPIHPIFAALPLGLWAFSFVADVIVASSNVDEIEILWFTLGYYTMAGGLAGALLAAVPGFVDFVSLGNRRLRRIASTHMAINLAVVALYAMNLWVRSEDPPSFEIGMGLSALALGLLAISGWLGGELVHVHGVGVAGHAEAQAAAIDGKSTDDASAARLGPTRPAPGRSRAEA